MNSIFGSSGKFVNFGLLVLRIGLGVMFIIHGLPKLQGGPVVWEGVGLAMKNIGVDIYPTMWGLFAALAEVGGGGLLLAGLLFKPATIILIFTMIVAAKHHLALGDGLSGASHAIELGIVLFSLLITGPGKFSIDNSIFPARGGDDDGGDD